MTNTARLAIPELAASELVSGGPTKINSALTTIDNINRGDQDFLQAGCVASTDWSLTGNINSSTGALGSAGNTGGTAWLPDPVISGALMRSVTTPATLSGIAPSLLPASTKFVSVAYELTPSTWGAKATVTAHSGVEKATEAEAIAAPPGTTAGKLQVRRVIVKNTAGVYSIVTQFDVRLWATGGVVSMEEAAVGKIGNGTITDAKVVVGRALVETGNAYVFVGPSETEHGEGELSATRLAFVIFEYSAIVPGKLVIREGGAGGEVLAVISLTGVEPLTNGTVSFYLRIKTKWYVTNTAPAQNNWRYRYLIL